MNGLKIYIIVNLFEDLNILLFGYFASGLEPDPNVPQIFPYVIIVKNIEVIYHRILAQKMHFK